MPNLASKVLRLALDRLTADWQSPYGHPVLMVETFVDLDQFCGTVYSANDWRNWARPTVGVAIGATTTLSTTSPNACSAGHFSKTRAAAFKPNISSQIWPWSNKVAPPCTLTVREIRSLIEHFKAVPDFRDRFESYPLWSMLTMVLLATLCGAPRGQKDLAKFARGLSRRNAEPLVSGVILKANIPLRHIRLFVDSSNVSMP